MVALILCSSRWRGCSGSARCITGFAACIGACRCCWAWLYPAQRHGWHMVPLGKLGAWLLLMVISYVMVSALHRGRRLPGAGADRWPQTPGSATLSG
jgi:hypothetical protein